MAISQTLVDRLNGLARLNQDAGDVYQQAINRLDNDDAKASVTVFRDNHRRHVQALARLLNSYGVQGKPTGEVKGFFLQNVTMLPPLSGDEQTLEALRSDEALVNERYREALDVTDLPEEVRQMLLRQRDEKARHLRWFDDAIAGRMWETETKTETGVSTERPIR